MKHSVTATWNYGLNLWDLISVFLDVQRFSSCGKSASWKLSPRPAFHDFSRILILILILIITQSHRHGWIYQGLWLPSHTDTAGHTKTFDYPVTQTRLDIYIPRPLITQSHRHSCTYQGLWLPSHTDTAGHTKAFDYPVTQTRLDISSHTDTAGHTIMAFDYPMMTEAGLEPRWTKYPETQEYPR